MGKGVGVWVGGGNPPPGTPRGGSPRGLAFGSFAPPHRLGRRKPLARSFPHELARSPWRGGDGAAPGGGDFPRRGSSASRRRGIRVGRGPSRCRPKTRESIPSRLRRAFRLGRAKSGRSLFLVGRREGGTRRGLRGSGRSLLGRPRGKPSALLRTSLLRGGSSRDRHSRRRRP